MADISQDDLDLLSKAFAFIGNSLLKPMSMTDEVGLDAAFWEAFPDFNSDEARQAKEALVSWAQVKGECDREQLVEDVSVEHTRLFIGPPSPAAAPWETMYGEAEDGQEITVGFGAPTFQMKQLLRERGLELSNENNQYEDHIGIELLYLSELCRAASQMDAGSPERAETVAQIGAFIQEHPAQWIDRLSANVSEWYPEGYIVRLLELAQALFRVVM